MPAEAEALSPQGTVPARPGAAALREAVCAETVRLLCDQFGPGLRAIVLTGSFARDEATIITHDGEHRVLGDAEFFVVFKERSPLPPSALTASLRRRAEHDLLDRGIRCAIDLSPVYPKYLSRLQPHILAYELKHCGRVLWGDPQILSLIPVFPASDIRLEDAWRLLCNRMIEFLAVAPGLAEAGAGLPQELFYRTVKLYLDMATSLLVFAGRYAPTYAARAAGLRSLLTSGSTDAALPFPRAEFLDRVEFCTRLKLEPAEGGEGPPAGWTAERAAGFWRDAVEYAHGLWRWELSLLTGSEPGRSDSALMHEWMRRQPPAGRLRGWVRVFRDAGWRCTLREWPRWVGLARQASPRHWVYAAAANIVFRLPALVGLPGSGNLDGFDLAAIDCGLPSPNPTICSAAGTGPRWVRTAEAVYRNYQRFVAVTTS